MAVQLHLTRIAGALTVVAVLAASPHSQEAKGRFREYVKVVERAYERVGLTVTVTGAGGRPLQGLTRERFRLFEDGKPVVIQDFGVEGERHDRPLSVALLLDLSQSMAGQVKRVREAARALLLALRPGDEIMVARFNHERTVLQTLTGDPQALEASLKGIGQAWGGTAIFRSIEQTLKDLRARPGRHVIFVVSDGLDNYHSLDQHILQSLYLQDLLRLCLRTQTVVYGIRPGMSGTAWLPFERFVGETGGRLLYTGGDLEQLFARLGEELLSQYYLAYDIDPKIKVGKRRRIRVEVSSPGARVSALGGFFTPRSHLETLLRDLKDEDETLRADAAYALGFVANSRATEALLEALGDKEERVRQRAVASLGRLEEVGAIGPITDLLGDDAASVREAASEAILLFGSRAIPQLVSEVAAGAGRRKAGPRILNAARLLGSLGDDRALAPLSGLLARGPTEGRVVAARALGELGLSRGIPALRGALSDASEEVRRVAIRSIEAIAGDPERAAVPP